MRKIHVIRFAVVALVAGGAIWLAESWKDSWQYRFRPRAWHVVDEGRLYRSGQIDARLITTLLKDHRIRTIITLTKERTNSLAQAAESRAARELGIKQFRFPLNGNGTGDIRMYANAIEQIGKAAGSGQACLVHCGAGTERTGAALYFYRVLVEQWPPLNAYRELVACGWNPRKKSPIPDYVNANLAELARILVDRGVIKKSPSPLPYIRHTWMIHGTQVGTFQRAAAVYDPAGA